MRRSRQFSSWAARASCLQHSPSDGFGKYNPHLDVAGDWRFVRLQLSSYRRYRWNLPTRLTKYPVLSALPMCTGCASPAKRRYSGGICWYGKCRLDPVSGSGSPPLELGSLLPGRYGWLYADFDSTIFCRRRQRIWAAAYGHYNSRINAHRPSRLLPGSFFFPSSLPWHTLPDH
jgi:hypothetical protein